MTTEAERRLEPWQANWRGIAPLLPTAGLKALREALVSGDPELIRKHTVLERPQDGDKDWTEPRPAGACAIGYCGWKGMSLERCGRVDQFVLAVGTAAGGATAFLTWYDGQPWDVVRPALLAEVEHELAAREGQGEDVFVEARALLSLPAPPGILLRRQPAREGI